MKTISFDFSGLFHRSYYVVKLYKELDINNFEGRSIFVRKVFTDAAFIFNRFAKDRTMCCFAFDDHSFRKEILDSYKGTRGSKEEAFYDISSEILEILQSKNFAAIKKTGLESDDILSLIAKKDFPSVIVSGDGDLKQIARSNSYLYNMNSKKGKIFIDQSFLEWYNNFYENFSNRDVIDFEDCNAFNEVLEKIALGCKTDEIPSLLPPGFGDKRVKNLFRDANINSFKALKQMLNLRFGITEEVYQRQLYLACLYDSHYPDNLDIDFSLDNYRQDEMLSLEDFVKDTRYFK